MKARKVPARVIGRCKSRVEYIGSAFAPTDGTYEGIDAVALHWATRDDTGITINRRSGVARVLQPLIATALFEVGFAGEAGPLSSWSN
jgi:hypothetical protein